MNRRDFIKLAGIGIAGIIAGGKNMPSAAQTEWLYRMYIFVEANRLKTANNLAEQWDPDTGGQYTFGNIRLSPTGQEPATHYGTPTPATETMRQGITTALGAMSWAKLYQEPEWTWESACADMGLIQIMPESVG